LNSFGLTFRTSAFDFPRISADANWPSSMHQRGALPNTKDRFSAKVVGPTMLGVECRVPRR
jgi:hypothetical protein